MTKNYLATILITVIITVIFEALVKWLIALTKKIVKLKTITDKIKIIFTKANRNVMFDLLSLLIFIFILINFALSKTAPTRWDILIAIGSVFASIFWTISLLWDLHRAIDVYKKTKENK